MSRTTKRVTLISLIVAGAGLVVALAAWMAGAQIGVRFGSDGFELVGRPRASDPLVLVAQTEIESFSGLEIRVSSADIRVVEGDGFALELWGYESGGRTQLHYELERGVLSVWDTTVGRGDGWRLHLGFHYPSEWVHDQNSRVIVTLPADVELAAVDIRSDFGDMDLSGLHARGADLRGSYGALRLGDSSMEALSVRADGCEMELVNVTAQEANLRNSFGSIAVRGGAMPQLTVSADSTDIDLSGLSTAGLTIKDNFGAVTLTDLQLDRLVFNGDSCDITANRVSAAQAEIRDNFGEIRLTGWSSSALELKTDSCAVQIDGALRGLTSIRNNFGDVRVTSSLPRAEYLLELEVDFGGITVDNTQVRDSYHEGGDGRAHKLLVDLDSGDIALRFGD